MEEIIYRQQNAAKPLDGKAFVVSITGIVLRLAIAQIVVNLFISLTGIGLLNLLFYLYGVLLLIGFMRRSVASYVYTAKKDVLILEKKMGDSTFSVVEIPFDSVISLRPLLRGERLKTTYRQVTVIDPETKPSLRVRAGFALSLVSARLARRCAGKDLDQEIGCVLVFKEEEKFRACTFMPDDQMRDALAQRIGGAYGFDERMTHAPVDTLYARALERAFPALYPYVSPLLNPEDVQQAREEMAARKAAKKKNGKAGARTAVKEKNEAAEGQEQTPARRRRKQG